jgi:hypothetical protein
LGGRKKTEKLGKKNCFAPTQIATLPRQGATAIIKNRVIFYFMK